MKTLYFDCFAGISGDMTVGALLDAGLDLSTLMRELTKLPVKGYRLSVKRVDKRGIQATKFDVILTEGGESRVADSNIVEVPTNGAFEDAHHHAHPHDHGHGPHRSLADILALIDESTLSPTVKDTASRIFTRLGEAEAKVHGLTLDTVHFHEVGGVDAIIDIVGTAIGLEQLGIDRIYASSLHLGSGYVRTAHGLLPVPTPATAELVTNVPVYTSRVQGELVTPTGAAIITTLAESFGPMPLMMPQAVGYGAGSRDRAFPNVVRVHLGNIEATSTVMPRTPFPEQHEADLTPGGYQDTPAVIIEANIDDMNPQWFDHLVGRLLAAQALDVLLLPVQMKKHRPGVLLQVLAHPDSVETLVGIIFTESTTIGLRTYPVTKHMLPREERTVTTAYGPVRVKVARLGNRAVNAAPEYEDCRALAQQHAVALKTVYDAARAAVSND